jgi:hypothetical protein
MAGVNQASKFESKTSDLLKAKKKSTSFVNTDWSWDGVNAINVYTLLDPTMNNYNSGGGANRYGNPTEVEDSVQSFALTRDRSWSKTIDKKNFQDTMMVRQPGKYLAQATKNVLVPEMDAYVFQTIATAANVAGRDVIVTPAATTPSNAYTTITTLNASCTDAEAPEEGRQMAMTAAYYNMVKQSGFVLNADNAYADRKSGNLGTIDNNNPVIVPSNRMPILNGAGSTNVDLIISHPLACVSPEKLVDYTLHSNPPGISGDLLEYRHRYDAFVDINKVPMIAVHRTS